MKQHTDWLKALIQEIPALASKTFVTIVRYPAPNESTAVTVPYLVIHPADGSDEATRLTGPRATQNPRFTLHSVGLTAEQATWVAKVVKDKLIITGLGITPTIAGERPGSVWWSSPIPLQIDTDVTPALCYHVAECGFSSDPA